MTINNSRLLPSIPRLWRDESPEVVSRTPSPDITVISVGILASAPLPVGASLIQRVAPTHAAGAGAVDVVLEAGGVRRGLGSVVNALLWGPAQLISGVGSAIAAGKSAFSSVCDVAVQGYHGMMAAAAEASRLAAEIHAVINSIVESSDKETLNFLDLLLIQGSARAFLVPISASQVRTATPAGIPLTPGIAAPQAVAPITEGDVRRIQYLLHYYDNADAWSNPANWINTKPKRDEEEVAALAIIDRFLAINSVRMGTSIAALMENINGKLAPLSPAIANKIAGILIKYIPMSYNIATRKIEGFRTQGSRAIFASMLKACQCKNSENMIQIAEGLARDEISHLINPRR